MLFRPPQYDTIPGYPDENNLTYNDDYSSVMQFISKNKEIPQKLETFKTSEDDKLNIDQLLFAIKESGDLNDPIFFNENCQLYSLYLLKEEKISITDFLTVNTYLIALMQFTDKQSLKNEDMDVKRVTEVKIFEFDEVKNDLLEQIKERYFDLHLYQKFDLDQFEKAINNLNKFEKSILGIKRFFIHKHDNIRNILNELSFKSPFMFSNTEYHFIPSTQLLKVMLNAMNIDYPVKMAPIFGNITPITLYKLHQKCYHPVSLYSKNVTSNPKKVHESRIGPLPALLHDTTTHTFWANLLSKKHYQFLYEYLLPKVSENLKLTFQDIMNQEYSSRLNLFKLIDLNLFNRLEGMDINKDNPNIYLYECLHYALGEDYENITAVAKMLWEDKDHIQKKYDINLVEVFADPLFKKMGAIPDLDLLALVPRIPQHERFGK